MHSSRMRAPGASAALAASLLLGVACASGAEYLESDEAVWPLLEGSAVFGTQIETSDRRLVTHNYTLLDPGQTCADQGYESVDDVTVCFGDAKNSIPELSSLPTNDTTGVAAGPSGCALAPPDILLFGNGTVFSSIHQYVCQEVQELPSTSATSTGSSTSSVTAATGSPSTTGTTISSATGTTAYAYGELGVDECRDGYSPIYDTVECSLASDFVGDNYNSNLNNNLGAGAVCNGRNCGASCEETRVSTDHGNIAKWLCKLTASAPTLAWYWVDDGCHTESGASDDYVGAYVQGTLPKAFARCCADDGVSCESPQSCSSEQPGTYVAAAAVCHGLGLRLCTKAELLSKVCCATGGECDSYPVWTSSAQAPTPAPAPTAAMTYHCRDGWFCSSRIGRQIDGSEADLADSCNLDATCTGYDYAVGIGSYGFLCAAIVYPGPSAYESYKVCSKQAIEEGDGNLASSVRPTTLRELVLPGILGLSLLLA